MSPAVLTVWLMTMYTIVAVVPGTAQAAGPEEECENWQDVVRDYQGVAEGRIELRLAKFSGKANIRGYLLERHLGKPKKFISHTGKDVWLIYFETRRQTKATKGEERRGFHVAREKGVAFNSLEKTPIRTEALFIADEDFDTEDRSIFPDLKSLVCEFVEGRLVAGSTSNSFASRPAPLKTGEALPGSTLRDAETKIPSVLPGSIGEILKKRGEGSGLSGTTDAGTLTDLTLRKPKIEKAGKDQIADLIVNNDGAAIPTLSLPKELPSTSNVPETLSSDPATEPKKPKSPTVVKETAPDVPGSAEWPHSVIAPDTQICSIARSELGGVSFGMARYGGQLDKYRAQHFALRNDRKVADVYEILAGSVFATKLVADVTNTRARLLHHERIARPARPEGAAKDVGAVEPVLLPKVGKFREKLEGGEMTEIPVFRVVVVGSRRMVIETGLEAIDKHFPGAGSDYTLNVSWLEIDKGGRLLPIREFSSFSSLMEEAVGKGEKGAYVLIDEKFGRMMSTLRERLTAKYEKFNHIIFLKDPYQLPATAPKDFGDFLDAVGDSEALLRVGPKIPRWITVIMADTAGYSNSYVVEPLSRRGGIGKALEATANVPGAVGKLLERPEELALTLVNQAALFFGSRKKAPELPAEYAFDGFKLFKTSGIVLSPADFRSLTGRISVVVAQTNLGSEISIGRKLFTGEFAELYRTLILPEWLTLPIPDNEEGVNARRKKLGEMKRTLDEVESELALHRVNCELIYLTLNPEFTKISGD